MDYAVAVVQIMAPSRQSSSLISVCTYLDECVPRSEPSPFSPLPRECSRFESVRPFDVFLFFF